MSLGFFFVPFLTPRRIWELGELQARWQHFSCESEALYSWVSEREKELEAVDGHIPALERQIHAVEVKKKEKNTLAYWGLYKESRARSHRPAFLSSS